MNINASAEKFLLEKKESQNMFEKKKENADKIAAKDLSAHEVVKALDKDFQEMEHSSVEDILASLAEEQASSGEMDGKAPLSGGERPLNVQKNIAKSADNIVQIAKGNDKNPLANWAQRKMKEFLAT